MSKDEWEAECDRRIEMENQMMEMPAENRRDFIAKAIAYTDLGNSELPCEGDSLWTEARALIGGAA